MTIERGTRKEEGRDGTERERERHTHTRVDGCVICAESVFCDFVSVINVPVIHE